MFDDKRMELESEYSRKLTNEVDIENIIVWTIISVVVIFILFAFFFDLIKLLFYLVPRFIYISLFNPLFLLGIAVIIGAGCSFGSLMVNGFKSRKFQKIDKNDEKILNNAIRKKISHFLQVNIGNAYSKEALLKRVVEKVKHPYFKKYIKNNGEKVLKNLVSEGKVLTTQKAGEIHYFTPPINN